METGVKCWELAGQVLVGLRAKDPSIFTKLCAKAKWLTPDTLWVFHRIGEGKLYPQLALMKRCPAESQLHLADIPTQKLLCTTQIDVVVAIKHDKPVIEKRWVQEIGKESIGVVFNNGNVRSLPEQEKILRSKKLPPVQPDPAPEPEKKDTRLNPIVLPKKLASTGWYGIYWKADGTPYLEQGAGPAPMRAQSIIIPDRKPGSTVVEFKQWVP